MKNLFTISQATKCCGLSRATILRLENKGLLTPAFVDETTGYRYYDNNNIAKILQIKRFLNMKLSYDDILTYYSSNGTSLELLKTLEAKVYAIKRTYEEMKLRIEKKEQYSFEMVTLPEYICFAKEYTGTTTADRYRNMYNLFHEVVEKGYKPLASEPLFIINKRTDFLEKEFTDIECNFLCCIPLEPDSAPKEATVFQSCRAFSCLYYGNYDRAAEVYNAFGRKIRELGLKPTGYPRALALVAPYTSLEFHTDNYVTRLVIPIEASSENEAPIIENKHVLKN